MAFLWSLVLGPWSFAASSAVKFAQSARNIDCYDFVEVTLKVANPPTGNPFLEAEVTGEFTCDGSAPWRVDGFCDNEDGSVFRIRFMPMNSGRHHFAVTYKRGAVEEKHTGSFTARKSARKGIVRVDKEHPFHFVWSGTGEHFFYNSTTTYWLLGWRDDTVIRESLDRLAKLKVNRIRVALNGRTVGGPRWNEPMIVSNNEFQYRLEPWPATRPHDIQNPGYDVSRFNLEHFRKAERMLRHARDLDVVVSLIFHLDGRDKGVDPFGKAGASGPDEQRYYRYAIARFGGFANVMWDVTNEYRLFRDDAWAEAMGAFVKQCDPYQHTTSIHGHETFRFRTSPWCDFAMYQMWDEHGAYNFMLQNRREQLATGRAMPQVNEEYGYEDHYPYPWGEKRKWPLRIAETRRKLAWEMTMAGGYQTTGERANIAGRGGWITGRGNAEMTMLAGYARMREFFEKFPWWELEPRPGLCGTNALCLAQPSARYVLYLREGGSTSLHLDPGTYRAQRFNPRTGAWTKLGDVAGGAKWNSPAPPDTEDWALLLERK